MTEFNLPPGKYVTTLAGVEVGKWIKNHFGRKARVKYLYLCETGTKLLLYEYENGKEGIQLIDGHVSVLGESK